MRKFWLLVLLSLCLLLWGCRPAGLFDTHRFELENTHSFDQISYAWEFGDLKGDGVDYLVVASQDGKGNHQILIRDQNGKVAYQLNYPTEIRGMRIMTDPSTLRRWLFVSYNDQEKSYLNAFSYDWDIRPSRQDKKFTPIPRTDPKEERHKREWQGLVYPKLLEDIDSDGSLELVCAGYDGTYANPRGLFVFDWDSGSLKWRLDLSTSLGTIICDDFNGDGLKEIICSNYAYKNTRETMHGIDDFNGWLLVVSPRGEVLYSQQAFTGYGTVQLTSNDLDGDGRLEIMAVYATWGNVDFPNSLNIFGWDGSRLYPRKKWETPRSFHNYINYMYFNVMDNEGNKRFLLPMLNSEMVVLDHNLTQIPHGFSPIVKYIKGVEDIDLDGSKEILLRTEDNNFVILDKNLVQRAQIRNPFPDDDRSDVKLVRAGLSGKFRIAATGRQGIRYYSYQKISLPTYMARLFVAISPWLCLSLLCLILAFVFMLRLWHKAVRQTISGVDLGVLVLSGSSHITELNSTLLNLLRDSQNQLPSGKLNSLKQLLPDIQATLDSFTHSKALSFSTEMPLGAKQFRHKVSFHRLRGFYRKFLIILQPIVQDPEAANDKLLWADTARRLSHNVRQHISNVLLALEPLQGNWANGDTPKAGEYVDIIKNELNQIGVFTHAFQRFTELKDTDLKVQNLIPSVEHCLECVRLPENVKLIKNWQLISVEAQIEPIRFEEALTNTLNNALEAMPDGGILHITVKKFPHHASPKGNLSVLVEVQDSGRGIPEKYREEIWQPFFTTKQSGTGIGLPVTKKIIESMGGVVSVESEEGHGTVVTFWLRGGLDG